VVSGGAMGMSSPKQTPPTPPPPPVRQTGADVAFEKEDQRKKQAARRGYADTMSPQRSLLAGGATGAAADAPKRSLLG